MWGLLLIEQMSHVVKTVLSNLRLHLSFNFINLVPSKFTESARWNVIVAHYPCIVTHHFKRGCTRWFKYDRDKLWLVYTQIVPVIFEPPCTCNASLDTNKITQYAVENKCICLTGFDLAGPPARKLKTQIRNYLNFILKILRSGDSLQQIVNTLVNTLPKSIQIPQWSHYLFFSTKWATTQEILLLKSFLFVKRVHSNIKTNTELSYGFEISIMFICSLLHNPVKNYSMVTEMNNRIFCFSRKVCAFFCIHRLTKIISELKNPLMLGPVIEMVTNFSVRFHPIRGCECLLGRYRYSSTLFLEPRHTRWGGWLTPRPGRLYSGKDPVPIVQEVGWLQVLKNIIIRTSLAVLNLLHVLNFQQR